MADKNTRVGDCITAIGNIARITAATPIYETPAEGSIKTMPYANALLEIDCDIAYETLRTTFKQWEVDAGRTPSCKLQGIVPLDIDIIKWNDTLLKERDMQYEYMQRGLRLLQKKD